MVVSREVPDSHAVRGVALDVLERDLALDKVSLVSSSTPKFPSVPSLLHEKEAVSLSLPSSPCRGAGFLDAPICPRNLDESSSCHDLVHASKEENVPSLCSTRMASSLKLIQSFVHAGSMPSGDVLASGSRTPLAMDLVDQCSMHDQLRKNSHISSKNSSFLQRRTDGLHARSDASPISGPCSVPGVPSAVASSPETILQRAVLNFESSDPNFPPLSNPTKFAAKPHPPSPQDEISGSVHAAADESKSQQIRAELEFSKQSSADKSKSQPSWASLVKGDPSLMQLSYIKPSSPSNEGKVRIKPPPSVALKGASIWKDTLVGFFLDKLPFSLIQTYAQKYWGGKGLTDVLSNGNGFFFFKFSDSVRLLEALEGGPWYFGGRPIFLKVWSPGMNLSKDGCKKVPIWAHFYNVPLEFWTDEGLSYVASTVGKPLYADKMTSSLKRLSYARICIEISIEDSLPNAFDIEMEDGSLMEIHIEYNWIPKKCMVCKEFGHLSKFCKKASHQVWAPKAAQVAPPPSIDGDWKHVKNHGKDVGADMQGIVMNPSSAPTNRVSSASGLCNISNSYEILHLDKDLTLATDVILAQPIAVDNVERETPKIDLNACLVAGICSSEEARSNYENVDSSSLSSSSSTPLLARKLNMIDEVEKKLGKKKKEKKKKRSSGNSKGKLSMEFK